MPHWGVRRWALAIVMGLLAPFLVLEGSADAVPNPSPPASTLRCGAKDLPETGIHGDVPLADQLSGRAEQGYNCGLSLVGYSSLGARAGNANMAWSGDCAYVAGAGVAVVDVRDPQHPKHVRTLKTGGATATSETLHAVDAPDRSILVTGRYGLGGFEGQPGSAPVDVWDVSTCANPKLLSTIDWPSNVHNLTLSADGKRVWSTLPVRSYDLTDPRKPKLEPSLEGQLAAQGFGHIAYAHEAWESPDGSRLYLGGQLPFDHEELLVIDKVGWPKRPVKVLGHLDVPGHSIRPMTIQGRSYLLASDESILNPTAKGCVPDAFTPFGGVARPFLVDISNEQLPRVTGQLRLPIAEPAHCVDQVLSGVNPSSHYHDVDDPADTTFAMVSMWSSGLRIFDVRNPVAPREVAYFNPGTFASNPLAGEPGIGTFLALTNPLGLDQAWAHVRYRQDTGQIWLTTATGGFWVLELEPQVREQLDLPARPTVNPKGAIPRPPATRQVVANASAAAAYCTIDQVRVPVIAAATERR